MNHFQQMTIFIRHRTLPLMWVDFWHIVAMLAVIFTVGFHLSWIFLLLLFASAIYQHQRIYRLCQITQMDILPDGQVILHRSSRPESKLGESQNIFRVRFDAVQHLFWTMIYIRWREVDHSTLHQQIIYRGMMDAATCRRFIIWLQSQEHQASLSI